MVKRAMSLNKELRARAREKSEDVTIKEEEAWEPCSTWVIPPPLNLFVLLPTYC